jgi:CRP-like cAMP-binding protein
MPCRVCSTDTPAHRPRAPGHVETDQNVTTLIDELRSAHLLASLSEAQLERVAKKARHLNLDEGKVLFSQGDPADRFYFLLRGQVKLYRLSAEGNEKIIEIVGPGHTFAEALMFLARPRYPVSCAALMPAELIAIDAADFTAMLRDSVETCIMLLGELSQRLRGLIAEIDRLSLQSATCRVAGYLLAKAPSDADEYQLEVPKGVVASRLSVKPETFSRIIKHLSESGIISVHGGLIRILDRVALRREAEAYAALDDATESAFQAPCE